MGYEEQPVQLRWASSEHPMLNQYSSFLRFRVGVLAYVLPLALVLVAPVAVAGSSGSSGPDTSDCLNAWSSSPAANSCTWVSVQVRGSNKKCYIEASCAGGSGNTNWSGSLDDTENLRNCDGSLRSGSC